MHIGRTYLITANYLNPKKAETSEVMRITRGTDIHISDNDVLQ
jgi:hypothetical protein